MKKLAPGSESGGVRSDARTQPAGCPDAVRGAAPGGTEKEHPTLASAQRDGPYEGARATPVPGLVRGSAAGFCSCAHDLPALPLHSVRGCGAYLTSLAIWSANSASAASQAPRCVR